MKLNDFMTAMQAIESDRQLSKEIVVDALQEALSKAFRKHIEIPDALVRVAVDDENGEIKQKTEDLVGPYELHDFFLYYFLRFGFRPSKIFYLANIAFKDMYDEETIKKWLQTFCRRFFNQQFKRSCLPDGPKVGSISLSPRGDWRMPSDASSEMWLREVEGL